MNYTKGDWKANGFSIYAGDRHILNLVTGDGKAPCLRFTELQSDLDLAAAAPQMYEALKAVYAVMERRDRINQALGSEPTHDVLLEQVFSARAKAEAKQLGP